MNSNQDNFSISVLLSIVVHKFMTVTSTVHFELTQGAYKLPVL